MKKSKVANMIDDTVAKSLDEIAIVLDFDGTLYPYVTSISRAVNELTGGQIIPDYEAVYEYDLINCWKECGFTQHLWEEAHLLCARSQKFHEIDPLPNAVEKINDFRLAGGEVVIQTVRTSFTAKCKNSEPADVLMIAEHTETWAKQHFNIPADDVYHIEPGDNKGRHYVPEHLQKKRIIFIDDSDTQIIPLRKAGEVAIVCGHKYNQDIPGPRFETWKSFDQALESSIHV